MHYLLPCSCGQKVPVLPSQAGGQVACACGKSLPVPTLRGIRQLEVAEGRPEKPVAAWTKLHGAFFSGGLLLAAVGAVVIAWYAYKYAQIGGYAIDRSEDFIRGGAAQIDTMTAAQLLEVWTNEVLGEGLGEPQQPYWVTAKQQIALYFWWIKFGAGAIVAGAAVAAVTVLVGRK